MIDPTMAFTVGLVDCMKQPSLTATMLQGLQTGIEKAQEEDGLVTVSKADHGYDFIDDIQNSSESEDDNDDEDGEEKDYGVTSFCTFCSSAIPDDQDFTHILEQTLRRLWRSEDEYKRIHNPHLPSFDISTFSSPPTDEQVDATVDYLVSLNQYGRWSGDIIQEEPGGSGSSSSNSSSSKEYNPDFPIGTRLLVDNEPTSLIARTKDGWYHFNEEFCSACLISRNDKDALLKILERDFGGYEGMWRDSPWPCCGCDEDEGVFTMDDVVKP